LPNVTINLTASRCSSAAGHRARRASPNRR
jgi:hypothetical protein